MNQKYTNEQKKDLCEKFLNSNARISDFARNEFIPLKTFEKWIALYRYNKMCFDTSIKKASFRSIKPQENVFDEKPNYSTMNIDELKTELLKRDIEIERLKKNYAVKVDSSGNKEYITFSKKTTK